MRILYVEDNPVNLMLLQRVTRLHGHDLINYTDGQVAIDNFDQDKPDLVLMDVQLASELDGLDVVQHLRAVGHKLPIIALTAYAMAGDKERCLAAGCNAYMSKPLDLPKLLALMEELVSTDWSSG